MSSVPSQRFSKRPHNFFRVRPPAPEAMLLGQGHHKVEKVGGGTDIIYIYILTTFFQLTKNIDHKSNTVKPAVVHWGLHLFSIVIMGRSLDYQKAIG